MHELIVEGGGSRQHRQRLEKLLTTTNGPLRLVSPYVTETGLLDGSKNRRIRLLTSIECMDIVSGATSLDCLKSLLEAGVECRYLPDDLRLHAKVYIFGEEAGVVTSANFTASGFDKNIEVGAHVAVNAVLELIAWFDEFWKRAHVLDLQKVSKWQKETAALRREYKELRKKASKESTTSNGNGVIPSHHTGDDLRELFDNAPRFFLCNTDRRQGERTDSDGYVLEEEMHRRGFAAAWRNFVYPAHMEQVVYWFSLKWKIAGFELASKG